MSKYHLYGNVGQKAEAEWSAIDCVWKGEVFGEVILRQYGQNMDSDFLLYYKCIIISIV